MNDDFDIRKLDELGPDSESITAKRFHLSGSDDSTDVIQSEKFQVKVAIMNEKGFIRVVFSQPVPYLNMTKKDAREFASRLSKAAMVK